MAQTKNTPNQDTTLILAARKSFALGVYVQDYNENPLDISASLLRIVMRKKVLSTTVDDSDNLITNAIAANTAPLMGFAQFFLQASDLDHPADEYMYTVTLIEQGYSVVLFDGTIVLEENAEFSSTMQTYSSVDAPTSIAVILRDQHVIKVRSGPTLPPGAVTYTAEEQNKVNAIFTGMVAAGTLITADDIVDGVTKVMMTQAERDKLASLSIEWDDIVDKPAFGTAALADSDDFLPSSGIDGNKITTGTVNKNNLPRVVQLNGISDGTGAAPSGVPFSLYLKHA